MRFLFKKIESFFDGFNRKKMMKKESFLRKLHFHLFAILIHRFLEGAKIASGCRPSHFCLISGSRKKFYCLGSNVVMIEVLTTCCAAVFGSLCLNWKANSGEKWHGILEGSSFLDSLGLLTRVTIFFTVENSTKYIFDIRTTSSFLTGDQITFSLSVVS